MYHDYQVVPAPVPISAILSKQGYPTRLLSRADWFKRYEGSLPSSSSSSLSRYRVEGRVLTLSRGRQYLYYDLPYSEKPYLEEYLFSKAGRSYGLRSFLPRFVARCVGIDNDSGFRLVRYELDSFVKGFAKDYPSLVRAKILVFPTIFRIHQLKRSVIDFSSIAEVLEKSYGKHLSTLREIYNTRKMTASPYWNLVADAYRIPIIGVSIQDEMNNRVLLYNTFRGLDLEGLLRGINDKRSLDVARAYYGIGGSRAYSVEDVARLLGSDYIMVMFLLDNVQDFVREKLDVFLSKNES